MLTFALTRTKNFMPNLRKRLQSLHDSEVQIGIFEGFHEEAQMNTATLLAIHEFGSSKVNLPPRPVLTNTFRIWEPVNKSKFVKNQLKKYFKTISKKDPPISFTTVLNNIGSFYEQKVKNNFGKGVLIPNTPFTVARKESMGRTGQNPLISSGELKASITYRIT